ncbi:MAG: type II secretion system F family protein [Elusimicrobiota bacterium]|jgi:tight adherence protein B|nr:type II secretion system F family protein [Elusimicrobiota bacterium]
MITIILSIVFGAAVFLFLYSIIKWSSQRAKESQERGSLKSRFLNLPPARRRTALTLFIFFTVFIVFTNFIFAAISSALYLFFDWNSRKKKDKQTAALIDSQVIESLTTIKSAVLAGQSLQNAIVMTSQELKEPIKRDFVQIADELVLGVDFDVVLAGASQRSKSKEFKFMIDTIRLSKDTGASLSGIFDRIIDSASQRIAMQGKVTALTAQGKMSGTVVSIIPFVIIGIMYLMQPDMTKILFTTVLGNLLLLIIVVMIVIGSLVIRKMTEVEL